MRRLAKELGVEAMSLYNHVENKDEILAGMIDLVGSEIELPSDEADWKAAVRRSAISAATRSCAIAGPQASGCRVRAAAPRIYAAQTGCSGRCARRACQGSDV